MTSNLRFFFLLLISLGSLHAQAPAEDGRLHFRTLGWMTSASDLFYEQAGKDVAVSVADSSRSVFFTHQPAERISFYRLVPGADGKLVRQAAGDADLTQAGQWPLLLFFKTGDGPADPYRIVSLADDLKSFPAPSCRFINLTPVELRASFGDQRFTLASRAMQQITPEVKSDGSPQTRYVTISLPSAQGSRPLYGNNWAVRPAQRTLVIIFPQNSVMQVHRIVDDIGQYTPPPPPAR